VVDTAAQAVAATVVVAEAGMDQAVVVALDRAVDQEAAWEIVCEPQTGTVNCLTSSSLRRTFTWRTLQLLNALTLKLMHTDANTK
jgi:hypothetical protein